MALESLTDFRLVGGTALSLLLGHRISEDIDLFAAKEYGSISFDEIEQELKKSFSIVINPDDGIPGMRALENNFGLHLFIGESNDALIKVDILNWGDNFIFPIVQAGNIRLAAIDEIAAMKLDVISRGGRKKDFWDMSEILETRPLHSLLPVYEQKYPYHDIKLVLSGLVDFEIADNMPDPICFKGKHWEVIQQEMIAEVKKL